MGQRRQWTQRSQGTRWKLSESSGPCGGRASRAVAIGGPLLCEGKEGVAWQVQPGAPPTGQLRGPEPCWESPRAPAALLPGRGAGEGLRKPRRLPPPPPRRRTSTRPPSAPLSCPSPVPASRPVASDAETLWLCLGSAAPRRASRCCISGDSRLAAPLRSAPATPLLPPPPAGPGSPGSRGAGCGPPARRDSVRSSPGAPTAPRARAGEGGEPGVCPFPLFATKCGARGGARGAGFSGLVPPHPGWPRG